MRRWLPSPLLSASLLALWLLLNQSISPGDLLLGLVVAVVVPLLTAPLRPQRVRLKRPRVLARLIVIVGFDVMVSAAQVAAGVLRSGSREPQSAFVLLPLVLRDPHALASLAIITAVVPGTVWTELSADGNTLLLHVFEVGDEDAFVARYKQRYERPLMEIFE